MITTARLESHLTAIGTPAPALAFIMGQPDLEIIAPLLFGCNLDFIKEWLVNILTPSTPNQYNEAECETRRLLDKNFTELYNRDTRLYMKLVMECRHISYTDMLTETTNALIGLDAQDDRQLYNDLRHAC